MSFESHFTHNHEDDLWLAAGHETFEYADGAEEFLIDLFDQNDVSAYPVELASHIHDWPSRYHLSHLRVNLLDSVNELIDPSWSVLELGAGPGALTRWLAERTAQVDVVEGSHARARANRLRTKSNRNVRIAVGDIRELPFGDTYDFATLVGVLEYVGTGLDRRNRAAACTEMLRKTREALRPDGVLLLAIENRLGAKYWAGCREDHSSRFFDGLLEYPNSDSAVTFSRQELETILADAGFSNRQFYHLFPDYKLPTVVLRETDELLQLNPYQWARGFAEEYLKERAHVLPDPVLLRSVANAGLLWHFSNSFMVLCSASPTPNLQTSWLARKYWNVNRPSLHHTIDLLPAHNGYRVQRVPLKTGASRVELGEYVFELRDANHVVGDSLAFDMYDALLSEQWEQRATALASELIEWATRRFAVGRDDEQGIPLLSGDAIDFTFWNLIRDAEGHLICIDQKWRSKNPIPADYLLFRTMHHTLAAFLPYLKDGYSESMNRVMAQIFPNADSSRLQGHYETESRFQSLAAGYEITVCPLETDNANTALLRQPR